jgi:hypothetical protein
MTPIPKPSRRVKPRKRVSPVRKTPRAAAKRSLAYRWRVKVKAKNGGRCVAAGRSIQCRGQIEAAHCFAKGPHPALQLALWNGLPLCTAHHRWYTARPGFWFDFLYGYWGAKQYDVNKTRLILSGRRVDLAAAAAELGAA